MTTEGDCGSPPLDIVPEKPYRIGSTYDHNLFVVIDMAEANERLAAGQGLCVVASGHPWHIRPSDLDKPYGGNVTPTGKTRRDSLTEWLVGLNASGRPWGYAVFDPARAKQLNDAHNGGTGTGTTT